MKLNGYQIVCESINVKVASPRIVDSSRNQIIILKQKLNHVSDNKTKDSIRRKIRDAELRLKNAIVRIRNKNRK